MFTEAKSDANKILGFGLNSMFMLSNILSIILLFRWVEKGFSLNVLSSILICVVFSCVLKLDYLGALIILAIPLILYAGLQIRRDGKSAWKQLSPGWDSKHCRHIYQLFAAAEVILFILTLFAFGNYSNVTKDNSQSVLEQPAKTMDSVANPITKPVDSVVKTNVPKEFPGKDEQSEASADKNDKAIKKENNKSSENGGSKVKSTETDAATYLDTHRVWHIDEMRQYPEIEDLNMRIIRSIQVGHPVGLHTSDIKSEKLRKIEKLLLCFDAIRIPEKVNRVKRIKINYHSSYEKIEPERIIQEIRDAIDRETANAANGHQ